MKVEHISFRLTLLTAAALMSAVAACADDVAPVPVADGGFETVEDGSFDANNNDVGVGIEDGASVDADVPDVAFEEVECGEPDDVARYQDDLYALRDCTTFRGSIILSDYSTPDLLQHLTNLRVVEGQVSLFRIDEVEDLNELSNLERVGSHLRIRFVSDLKSLEGLSRLQFVGGTFFLEDTKTVTTPAGLESLGEVDGDFLIYGSGLVSLSEFESLSRIGGDAKIRRQNPLPQSEIDDFLQRVDVEGEVILD